MGGGAGKYAFPHMDGGGWGRGGIQMFGVRFSKFDESSNSNPRAPCKMNESAKSEIQQFVID